MTPLEQAILLLLRGESRLAIARAAKELDQPQSAILRAVSGLEQAGLVVRSGNYIAPK